jgi:hypothetical protein
VQASRGISEFYFLGQPACKGTKGMSQAMIERTTLGLWDLRAANCATATCHAVAAALKHVQ